MDNIFDRTKNLESLILIWLDMTNVFNNAIEIKMRTIIDYFKLFKQIQECDEYIRKIQHQDIFIIISIKSEKKNQIERFLSSISQLERVHEIYVYLVGENNCQNWNVTYSKVRSI